MDELRDLVDEIRANVEMRMLYDMICDANHVRTFDELHPATGLARGTLQNIVAGNMPKIF